MNAEEDNPPPEGLIQWLKDEYEIRDVDVPPEVLHWLLAEPRRFFSWRISHELGMLRFEVDRLRKQLVALSTHLGGYDAEV